jgi:hypothetical protein
MSDFNFLGKDIKLGDDMDIEFTPDGDFATVEGALCVAQDVKSAIYESDIYKFLNDDEASIDDIKSFIEDILINEPRVDITTIIIEINKTMNGNEIDYECKISFDVIGENNKQNLVFNLSEVINLKDLNNV